AVVAEQAGHAGPDGRDLVGLDERAQPGREHRVGRKPAAYPQVEARGAAGPLDADKGDVVDLVDGAVRGATRDRGLVLARQVAELRVAGRDGLGGAEHGGRVDDLIRVDAGHRAAEDVARDVAAGLDRGEADLVEALPDRGYVFDPDPVELDVLPVGDVGYVAAVLLGDATDRAQLGGAELAAGDAHPHHEVAVLELFVLEHGGLAARDAGPALGVQAPPAEAAAQVSRVDGLEPGR